MFAGWYTPTEAGAIGAAGVMVLGLLERRLGWEGVKNSLSETTMTTAMIMLLVGGAIIFGRFMAVSEIPTALAAWASSLPLTRSVVMSIILFINLVLGCFIDALALILLTIPIFYPVAVGTLGYDPILYGGDDRADCSNGVITPPVGINVYLIKGISGGTS